MNRLTRKAVVATLVLAAVGFLSAGAAAGRDVCDLSAEAVRRACQAGARSDYWLADAKCLNLADVTATKDCRQLASADLRDALDLCDSQDELRDPVCARLGPGPYAPAILPANFSTTIDNPYFPLIPGTTFIYEGQTADGFEHVEFAVTHATKVILGVTCVEIHDTRRVNGELLEDTRDWFAQDVDGNVWYFGENTTLVDGGLPVDLSGTWTGGVDGAMPGMVMKAAPAIGDFYRQEYFLGEAEDLAEVKSRTDSVTVPYGSFSNCLKTEESSPLAPGDVEHKFYRAGVGNVLTIDLATGERSELVQIVVTP